MDPCSTKTKGKDSYFKFPCFFCKRQEIETNSRIKLFLSKIFNYIQLFPRDGKGKRLCYPSDEILRNLSICQNCSEMGVEFSELYHILEVTELRLNRCLDRMQEVMIMVTEAEHEISISKPNDQEEEEDDLRTVMMRRITEISKLPHVALRSRNQIVPSSAALDNFYSRPKASDGPPEAKDATALNLDADEKMESDPSLPESDSKRGNARNQFMRKKRKKTRTNTKTILLTSTSSNRSKVNKNICKFCHKKFARFFAAKRHMKYNCIKNEERLPPPSPPDTALLLTCAYCDYDGANRPVKMNHHLIRRHPEMFFQSERNNSSLSSPWKQENFESILKEIVFPKLIIKNVKKSSCLCSVCGKKYGSKKGYPHNRSELTVHLMSSHIEALREHLKGIMGQSDAELQKVLYKGNRKSKSSNTKVS